MNYNGAEFFDQVAADLDRFADVSTDQPHGAVSHEGLCQWIYTAGYATDNLWDLLPADQRRRVHLAWVQRRDEGAR